MARTLVLLGIPLFVFHSSNSQWTIPRSIDSTTNERHVYPLIAIGPQRQIGIVCSDDAQRRKVILYLSTNNGASFSRSIIYECLPPDPNFGGTVVRRPDGLSFDSSGNISVLWRAEWRDELWNPQSSIFNLSRSTDSGSSFQSLWTRRQTYGIPLTSRLGRCPMIVDPQSNVHFMWDSSARRAPDFFKCIYTRFTGGNPSSRFDLQLPKPPSHLTEDMELDFAPTDSALHYVVNMKMSGLSRAFKLYYARLNQPFTTTPTLIPVDTVLGTSPSIGRLASRQLVILYGSGSGEVDSVLTARLVGDTLSPAFRLTSIPATRNTTKSLRSYRMNNYLVFGYANYPQEPGTAFYEFSDIRQAASDSAFFPGYLTPDFAIDSLGGKYIVMVRQNRLYLTKKDVVTSSPEINTSKPSHFALQQNYPNPFNPSTSIVYTVGQSTLVKLNVFDVLGREVASLVNERKNAGKHEVVFDASDLPSGVYFYRLTSQDFVGTKKMILLQ